MNGASDVRAPPRKSGILWELRTALRTKFFQLLRRVADTDDAREILGGIVREHTGYPSLSDLSKALSHDLPYVELGRDPELGRTRTRLRSDIVFVTGRFRSGSTLFWNLFRQLPGVTSYYEPFNERRWFDKEARGSRIDPTHLGIEDYWAEYDGLDSLGELYNEEWTRRQLFMDARAWNPSMQRYVEVLVEKAKGRAVLQFNRVDFRLPWLRHNFPNAKILHIFRHPRDQWCSTLGKNCQRQLVRDLGGFAQYDGFYLLNWGRDLGKQFPFLTLDSEANPYELFYQIWKLSYAFGLAYGDISVSFEEIINNPATTIGKVLSALDFGCDDLDHLAELVSAVPIGKWAGFADQSWFEAIEEKVDCQFNQLVEVA